MKDVLFWIGCILFFAGVFIFGCFFLFIFNTKQSPNNKDIGRELNNILFAIVSFAILSVGAYLIINTM
jgi:hypothetical protein